VDVHYLKKCIVRNQDQKLALKVSGKNNKIFGQN